MMRPAWAVLLAASVCAMTGCGDLLSLHALYTRQDQVFDPVLEGKWENKDNFLTVTRAGDMYEMTLRPKSSTSDPGKFEAHFVDVNGVRFADLLPSDQIGHMIVRVRPDGGKLHVAFLDSEWLRQTAPHDDADIENFRKQAVLTLKTPQLKELVAKYASEPRAYDKEIDFQRVK